MICLFFLAIALMAANLAAADEEHAAGLRAFAERRGIAVDRPSIAS